jgi:hypothetical protein
MLAMFYRKLLAKPNPSKISFLPWLRLSAATVFSGMAFQSEIGDRDMLNNWLIDPVVWDGSRPVQ